MVAAAQKQLATTLGVAVANAKANVKQTFWSRLLVNFLKKFFDNLIQAIIEEINNNPKIDVVTIDEE